jgi:DNA repair photolyase
MAHVTIRGRGASYNPPNRFERMHIGAPPPDIQQFFDAPDPERREPTVYLRDRSKSILSANDSNDVPFTYSVNPYRGCAHGCVYCYARPTHEYLGFSSGLDFETRIVVKEDAPELLAKALRSRSWKPQRVALSGNTDCYQPVEQQLRLTRRCLEVLHEHRNPTMIITKNALIQRDIDLLRPMASLGLVSVHISLTTLRQDVVARMEPRTSSPRKRLETIQALAEAGVPTGVLVAPLIPGLNDEELPAILSAAREHGAIQAGYVLLRLPHSVREIFVDWLERAFPEKAARILGRIRSVRGGSLTDATYGKRMKGTGPLAEAIERLFHVAVNKAGFEQRSIELATHHFRRHGSAEQAELFEEAVTSPSRSPR